MASSTDRPQISGPQQQTSPRNQDNMNREHETENGSHGDMVRLVATLKEKNDALQRELEALNLAYADRIKQNLNVFNTLKIKTDALEFEIDKEKRAHEDRADQDLQLINTLKAEIKRIEKKAGSHRNDLVDLRKQLNVMSSEKRAREDKAKQDAKQIDTLRAEKEALQRELETVTLAYTDKVEQDTKLIDTLRTETDTLRKEMAEKTRMQKEADHKAMLYQRELEELRNQLNAEKPSSSEQPDNNPGEQHGSPVPSVLHDQDATENAVVSEKIMTETTKQKSRWKRFRHFLGLRKPQKWKK